MAPVQHTLPSDFDLVKKLSGGKRIRYILYGSKIKMQFLIIQRWNGIASEENQISRHWGCSRSREGIPWQAFWKSRCCLNISTERFFYCCFKISRPLQLPIFRSALLKTLKRSRMHQYLLTCWHENRHSYNLEIKFYFMEKIAVWVFLLLRTDHRRPVGGSWYGKFDDWIQG